MAVVLKRGPKKGSRSDYNIYMKNTTPIIRNEYENITKTRSEQYSMARAGWPEIREKLKEMRKDVEYKLDNITKEEQNKIAGILVMLEKEGWND
jgi:hypothetical protein